MYSGHFIKKPEIFEIDFKPRKAYLLSMFDDDLPKATKGEFPRDLERMSLSELSDYVHELKNEITRVEADAAKKKASQDAAASIFKS